MKSKSNKGFTLLELLITATILAGAVVFIFRSFTAVLSAQRLSQNIVLACFFADDKLQELGDKQRHSPSALEPGSGLEEIAGRQMNWDYKTGVLAELGLIELKFNVSWKEKAREAPYAIEVLTYLTPQR